MDEHKARRRRRQRITWIILGVGAGAVLLSAIIPLAVLLAQGSL